MYTRETFDQIRAASKQGERRDSRILTVLAVGLGVAQLLFIRWAETRFERQIAVPLEVTVFLLYAVLVTWLILRMLRNKRASSPSCPQCRRALQGLSERVAVATGRCDSCGGQVLR